MKRLFEMSGKLKRKNRKLSFYIITCLLVSVFLTLSAIGCRRGTANNQSATITSSSSYTYTSSHNNDLISKSADKSPSDSTSEPTISLTLNEQGTYDSKDEVAEFIWTYHRLPNNYMDKKEARARGWENGPLHLIIDGKCIGGDYFGNYEGTLPQIKGRRYYECDIDTLSSKSRGPKRIVYTDDGWNIYYTEDHYETFEHLYGDDEE